MSCRELQSYKNYVDMILIAMLEVYICERHGKKKRKKKRKEMSSPNFHPLFCLLQVCAVKVDIVA